MKNRFAFLISTFFFTQLCALAEDGVRVAPPPPVAKKAVWGTGNQPEAYSSEEPGQNRPGLRKTKKTTKTPRENFQVAFSSNYLFSTQTKNKITGTGITAPVTTSKDGRSLAFGVEGTYHPIQSTWGVTLLLETSKYAYRNQNRISDRHMGMWIAPRIQGVWDRCTLWASLGFGLMKSTFPGGGYTENGYHYAVAPAQGSTYSYTIRFGSDFYLTNSRDWFIGPHLTYTEFMAKNTGELTRVGTSNSAVYKNEMARNWIALGLKVGLYF